MQLWLLVLLGAGLMDVAEAALPLKRPPYASRTFHSTAVDDVINTYFHRFIDPDVAVLFHNCLPNTLDTTVGYHNSSDSFVITGDIEAMWLRDSMNQMLPYMSFLSDDPPLRSLVCGVVRRQAHSVSLDPYANAFNFNLSGKGHQKDTRRPSMTPGVFEGKYELDSLAAFLKVSNQYYAATQDTGCFADYPVWITAITTALDVISRQMQSTAEDEASGWWYSFARETSVATDTLMQDGQGPPAARTNMSKSAFRGSDDAQTLPFHIPANAMAVVELRGVVSLLNVLGTPAARKEASRAQALADMIDSGIRKHGVLKDGTDMYFAYEVDGFGSAYFMDDANIPGLLSLPRLGFVSPNDTVYLATRRRLLDRRTNPFFFSGSAAEGIGSPHTGYGKVWPMSLITQAFTSTSDQEISHCLRLLVESSAGTGFLHESFNASNPSDFTRPWFAWVNGYFGELILHLINTHPHLVLQGR